MKCNTVAHRVYKKGQHSLDGPVLNVLNALQQEIYVVCPLNATILQLNEIAEKKIGAKSKDLAGTNIRKVFANISAQDLKNATQPLINGSKRTVNMYSSLRSKSSPRRKVQLRINKLDDAARPLLLISVLPQKTNKEAERLANVSRNHDSSIIIFDENGSIEWTNEGFTKLTGFEPEMAAGKNVEDLLHGTETNLRTIAFIKYKLSALQEVNSELCVYGAEGNKIWAHIRIYPTLHPNGRLDYFTLYMRDISERKRIEEAARTLNAELAEEKERFELAVIGSDNGIWDWDMHKNTVHYSSRFRELLGYTEEDFPNKLSCFPEIVHPDDSKRAKSVVEAHLRNQTPYDLEYRLKTKDGSYKWFRSKGQALWDSYGNPIRMAGSISDISNHKRNEQAIKRLAKTDALTGLPNRTLFHEQLSNAITTAKRNGTKVGVALIDLDHFKDINDTMGHPAGDELLRQVAKRILNCVRDSDTVTRLGGDEFAVVATSLETSDDIKHLANRIVTRLSDPFDIDGQILHSGASIGITVFPECTGDSDDLLRNADIALYSAKGAGRGTYRIYDSNMNKRVQIRRMIERDLRNAIEHNELELHYQPQLDISTMRVVGAEALLRWNHPERGPISPGEFIPIAEASRLIMPLGEWVLNTACEQNQQWQRDGLPPIVVAVNVSPLQFKHQDMLPNLFEAVAASGLAPKWLEVEITEAAAMEYGAVRVLNELKDFGVNLAIDDFGTGYSSLSRLKNFPVDRLKIDRSFVRSTERQPDHAAVCTAIIQLGHALGLNVIAEGVETVEELQHLSIMGCDNVQGFLFGKPMPAPQFAEFLRVHSPQYNLEQIHANSLSLEKTG